MASTTLKFSEYLDNTKFYCGLDVHKYQLAVCIYGKDDAGHEYSKCETFGTDPAALESFFSFTARFRPVCYGMEATNVYHHPIATLLEKKANSVDWDFKTIIFNPSDASGIPGHHKHDRLDASRIAKYLHAGLLKPGQDVNVVLEDMCAVFRTAHRLERDRTALKNRIKKTLDRAGFRPRKLNLNSQWVIEFLHALCDRDGTLLEVFTSLKADDNFPARYLASIERNGEKFEPYHGIALSGGQKALVKQDLVELDFKTARITLLGVEVDRLVAKRPGLRQSIVNLASIPGMSAFTAAWLVAEVGPFSRYPSHRKFSAYCGCCERVVKSAHKTYSAHTLRRSNKYVRTMMYNTARVLCHVVKEDSALIRYCKRVYAKKRHRSPKLAYCTIATKLSRIIYAMLRDGTGFDPALGRNSRAPVEVGNGLLTVTDLRKVRNAAKALERVSKLKQLPMLSMNASMYAEALEALLKSTKKRRKKKPS
jgi:transposase